MMGRRQPGRDDDNGAQEAVLRDIQRVSDRAAAGDFSQRVQRPSSTLTGPGPDLALAACAAVNQMLDRTQAFVTETATTLQAAGRGRFDHPFGATDLGGGFGTAASAISEIYTQLSRSGEQNEARAQVRRQLADEFESSVMTMAQQVAAAATELSASAAGLGQSAAAAAGEATRATGTVSSLQDSSREIEQVVALIVQIAAQTKLLALNATIEAARAGSAGQGFAVVAEEVKSLADETSRAAEQVTTQVQAVQSVSGQSTQVMQGIGATVGEMASMVEAIGTAVDGSDGGGGYSGQFGSTLGLSQLAETMRAEVSRFLVTLRE